MWVSARAHYMDTCVCSISFDVREYVCARSSLCTRVHMWEHTLECTCVCVCVYVWVQTQTHVLECACAASVCACVNICPCATLYMRVSVLACIHVRV